VGVTLSDGSRHEVDLALIAVGIEPNLDLPKTLGLPIDGGGVRVDEGLRAAENVYVGGDIALHKHPVIIFGTTAGYDHSSFGPTHQTVDDWGMLRTIPNIEIHCPTSLVYAEHLMEDLLNRPVPAYLRVPKDTPL